MKYGNKYGVNEDYLSLSCYHRNHRRPDCYKIGVRSGMPVSVEASKIRIRAWTDNFQ